MRQVFRRAQNIVGQTVFVVSVIIASVDAKGAPDAFDHSGARGFVQCDADIFVVDGTQVDAFFAGGFQNGVLKRADMYGDRIKEVL